LSQVVVVVVVVVVVGIVIAVWTLRIFDYDNDNEGTRSGNFCSDNLELWLGSGNRVALAGRPRNFGVMIPSARADSVSAKG
jgi:hypothetical protein